MTATSQPFPTIDFSAAIEQVTAANRKAGNDYLDIVERTAANVADWQLKAARTIQVPGVESLVTKQVETTRDATGTLVKTARELLKA